MDVTVSSIEDLGDVVEVIAGMIENGYRIFLLSGNMGSGKTTFVKVLCGHLGVADPVSSPTFSLINEYHSPALGVIYHMDLYRIEKTKELAQIGLEEYLDSGHLCLIEWPEIASPYYYIPYVWIKIEVKDNNIRIFNITTHDTMDA